MFLSRSLSDYLIPKAIFLSFGLQFYLIYQFRSIFFINGFLLPKDIFGNFYGLFMLLIFIISLLLTYFIDKYKISKRNILVFLVISHMTTIIILFSFTSIIRKNQKFCLFLFFCLLLCHYPQNSIIDKIMLDYLSNRHSVATYGNQKLFETIGFAVSTYFQELKGNLGDLNGEFNYFPLIFVSVLFSLSFVVLIMLSIKAHQYFINVTHKTAQSGRNKRIKALGLNPVVRFEHEPELNAFILNSNNSTDILSLLNNTPYIKFILVALLMGITRTGTSMYITNFYMDYLETKNQNILSSLPRVIQKLFFMFKNTPVTIAVISCVIAEILLLFNTQKLIKRYGVYTLLLFGILAQTLRIFICLFLHPTTKYKFVYVVIIEFLKGITYGVFQPAGVILAEKLASSEYKMLSQLCFSGMFNGIAFFISGLIFGWIFKEGFSKEAFRTFFGCVLSILGFNLGLVFLFYYVIERKLFVTRKYT
ncbi:hypothetical protein CDIK_0970 [Cucumispora dikerogammari]|nr:hypothetical protein CDIK_0970 [Cucumispora dikerogammari]